MKIVKFLIKEILAEDAYKKKTGFRFNEDIKAVANSVNKPGYFLHFSDVPKIGINPSSGYFPGLYMYPNTQEIYDFIFSDIGNFVGAGRGARYVYLVKLNPNVKILEGYENIKRIVGQARAKIMKPLFDAGVDAGLTVDKKSLQQAALMSVGSMSKSNISFEFPSLEEMKENGLFDIINEKNERYNNLYKRLNTKNLKSNDDIIQWNKEIKEVIEGLSMNYYKYQLPVLKEYDKKYLTKKIKEIEKEFSANFFSLQTDDNLKKFEDFLKTNKLPESWLQLKFPFIIARSLINDHLLVEEANKYSQLETKHTIKMFLFLNDLIKHPKDLTVKSKEGKFSTIDSKTIAERCIDEAKKVAGKYSNFLMKAIKDIDDVGVNIALSISGFDGINDTSTLSKETIDDIRSSKVKSDRITYRSRAFFGMGDGKMGILGKYESQQLFIFPPLQRKFKIVTMIDRFEGDKKDPPGSATPDVDWDRRPAALKKRIYKDPDNFKNREKVDRWKVE